LYNERIYGYNGNNSRMDGTLQHNITELTKKLNILINKIEFGKTSISEEIAEKLFSVNYEDK
jgi:butyrate kinase